MKFISSKPKLLYIHRYTFLNESVHGLYKDVLAGGGVIEASLDNDKINKFALLDSHGIPRDIIGNKQTFKAWFEKEFFTLDEEGIQRAHTLLSQARKSFSASFDNHTKSTRFSVAKSVEYLIEKKSNAFTLDNLFEFFKFVAVGKEEVITTPDMSTKGSTGHNRHSACKILKRALAMYTVEKAIEGIGDWAKWVEGDGKLPDDIEHKKNKAGLFGHWNLELSQWLKEAFDLIEKGEWHKVEQKKKVIDLSSLIIDSDQINGVLRVELRLKDIMDAVRKVERDPKTNINTVMNDIIAMRIVLKDDIDKQDTVCNFTEALSGALNNRGIYSVLEVKDKGYFSDSEELFNLMPKSYSKNFVGVETIPENKARKSAASTDWRAVGIKVNCYKNSQLKEERSTAFAFEIQLVTEEDNTKNESLNSTGSHLTMKLIRFIEQHGRKEGKMKKEEHLSLIEYFIKTHIKKIQEKGDDGDLLGVFNTSQTLKGKKSVAKLADENESIAGNFLKSLKNNPQKSFPAVFKIDTSTTGFNASSIPNKYKDFFIHNEQDGELVLRLHSAVDSVIKTATNKGAEEKQKIVAELLFYTLLASNRITGASQNFPSTQASTKPQKSPYYVAQSTADAVRAFFSVVK